MEPVQTITGSVVTLDRNDVARRCFRLVSSFLLAYQPGA